MSRAEGGAGTSRADAPRIDPAELFRREIPRPLHLGHTGGPRLSRPGPAPGPAWTSRAEGGAGTSRADAPRIDPAELFRREIPRPLHLGHTGGPRLSRPGPAPGPAWTSRAEGGAGTSRADAPRIAPAELFRREIPRPLHPRRHGRAALVAARPCAGSAWTSRADAPRIAPAELFRSEIPRPLHPRPHGRAALVAAGHRMGPHPPRHGPAHTPPTAWRAKYPRALGAGRPHALPLSRVGPGAQWPRRGAQCPPTPCRNRRTH